MSVRPHKRSCILGVFSGVYRHCDGGVHGKSLLVFKIRCGRWDCPYCGPRKARRVFKRAMNGGIAAEAQRDGFRGYNIKLLTLTYGGKGKRATSTPAEAALEMQVGWAKLRKEIRHLFGGFDFLKVFETHEDGWPHLHVVLCGESIASAKVLGEIQRLWRYRYGFGFVKLNWCSDPKKALKYILKYLFKCPGQFKKIRRFSASEGALLGVEKREKREWEGSRLLWRDGKETYRECAGWLDKLKDEEVHIEMEVYPVKDCPF